MAQRIAASIIEAGGYSYLNMDKVSHTPRNDAVNVRSLDFLRRLGDAKDQEVLAGFFNKDLGHTMMSYIERCRPGRAKRRPVVPGRRRSGRIFAVAEGCSSRSLRRKSARTSDMPSSRLWAVLGSASVCRVQRRPQGVPGPKKLSPSTRRKG